MFCFSLESKEKRLQNQSRLKKFSPLVFLVYASPEECALTSCSWWQVNNRLCLSDTLLTCMISGNFNISRLIVSQWDTVSTQPLKSHYGPTLNSSRTFCLQSPSQLPLSLYKRVSHPLVAQALHMALHACRPQIAILCWSRINPFFAGEITGNLFV